MPRVHQNLTVLALRLLGRDLRLLGRALRHDFRRFRRVYAAGWYHAHHDY